MKKRSKKLEEQVIVITGASSGIGLVTAKLAASRGARVVLAARNQRDLDLAVREIEARGGEALAVQTDVADLSQVERLAARAIERFGGFDTWVNNAAVAIYGRLWDLPLVDAHRQMDVNFWGTTYGSMVALHHLRTKSDGGIINVTSALADRAIPLQGIYCAAKHAIKGLTDTLRMEIEEAQLPIAVTQVKPGSIDTPFFEKARTFLDHEPQPVPPVYAPELVAKVIVACCEAPRRDVIVSAMGKVISTAGELAPTLTDRYMERNTTEKAQASDIPVRPGRRDNLYAPVLQDGGAHGRNWGGRTKRTSLYTWAAMHTGAALLGALALVAAPVLAMQLLRR
jgi:NAD(P)-dependent dehydrogenase (short-subunit alcohol dehydrogenase family)